MAASRGAEIELQLAACGDGGVSSERAAATESCSAGNGDTTSAVSAIDEQFPLIDGSRTVVGIRAGEQQRAGVALVEGTCTTDHTAEGLIGAAVVGEIAQADASNRNIACVTTATKHATTTNRQRAGTDCRISTIGVHAGQEHRARARLGQRAGAGNAVGKRQVVAAVDNQRAVVDDLAARMKLSGRAAGADR